MLVRVGSSEGLGSTRGPHTDEGGSERGLRVGRLCNGAADDYVRCAERVRPRWSCDASLIVG